MLLLHSGQFLGEVEESSAVCAQVKDSHNVLSSVHSRQGHELIQTEKLSQTVVSAKGYKVSATVCVVGVDMAVIVGSGKHWRSVTKRRRKDDNANHRAAFFLDTLNTEANIGLSVGMESLGSGATISINNIGRARRFIGIH